MEATYPEQNSLGLTAAHDVYEVRPRKDRDGFDLISECFDTARSGMQGLMRSVTRSHTRSIAPTLGRSGQLSACWTTPAL